MARISIKGVVIGGIVDVFATIILTLPFALYTLYTADLTNIPQDQLESALTAAMRGNTLIYATQLLIGLGCSVLGGYVAGRLAKDSKVLNGALSSFLCLALGVYTLSSGNDSHPMLIKVLLMVASPVLALCGGYLSLRHHIGVQAFAASPESPARTGSLGDGP